jgi:hypothetical protein
MLGNTQQCLCTNACNLQHNNHLVLHVDKSQQSHSDQISAQFHKISITLYKDECMYITHTNPHFWTDLNQTLHTSPPWSGGGRTVCMDPEYFNFPTISTYFVGSEFLFACSRVLPAPRSPTTASCQWCGAGWCDVMGVTCTLVNAQKMQRSEWNARVWKWKPDETGRKWIMNCTCNWIAFIQMIV